MARILIVDDDEAIRRMLRRVFERGGSDVIDVPSGEAALEFVARDRPDAVVCDVKMPGMNGIDFYRRLSEVAPGLQQRLIFVTGASRDPAVADPIEQLGVPLLGKLDDLQVVVDAVKLVILKAQRRP